MVEQKDICSVRSARTTDAREIAALINTAFQVEKFFVVGDRIAEEGVCQLIDRGCFLMAEDTGGLAGCVYVETQVERAYLGLLSTSPSRQRQGVGRQLMLAAEKYAHNAGCKFMDLRVVNLRTELPPYYRSLGYEVSRVEAFPSDVPTKIPCHFIVMTKPLT
jgi:predicted N-acetyltransferase YhbS